MVVGTTVKLKVSCLGNNAGALGVCYSKDNDLGRPSYGVIFENGNYDGFSPEEVRDFLEETGFAMSVRDYQFTNVMKLSRDFDDGVFHAALLTGFFKEVKWNTDAIIKLLTDARWNLEVTGAGGDCDTECIILRIDGYKVADDMLYISGFTTDCKGIPNTKDCEIESIEVSDGKDSQGGLNSSDENLGVAYGVVCSRLRKAGFSVVSCMKDYF